MIIPGIYIGLISSLVTELLKLIPFLSKTDERKRAVAFILAFLICLGYLASQAGYQSEDIAVLILAALSSSFAIYKTIVQPVVALAKPCGRFASKVIKRVRS